MALLFQKAGIGTLANFSFKFYAYLILMANTIVQLNVSITLLNGMTVRWWLPH